MSNAELLERFLPGYRLVCRISARYLGIDLTDVVSKAFVFFAVLKSIQYVWSSLSGVLRDAFTCSIEVPEGVGTSYDDVLSWVVSDRGGRRGAGRRVALHHVNTAGKGDEGHGLFYVPARDCTVYLWHDYRVVAMRRERLKNPDRDVIMLTCIGLTTEPLRTFLDECVLAGERRRRENGSLAPLKATREEMERGREGEEGQPRLEDEKVAR